MSRTLALQRIGAQLTRHSRQQLAASVATASSHSSALRCSASAALLPFVSSHNAQSLNQQSPMQQQQPHRSFGHGPLTAANDKNPMYVPLSGRQLEASELGNYPDQPGCAPFGTLQYPALIYSGLSSRIVGCLGGGKLRHRLMWFVVKEGKPHVCQECGQVFKLVNDDNWTEVESLLSPETKAHYYEMDRLRKRLMEKEIGKMAAEFGPPAH